MKNVLVAATLGAALASSPALAQEHAGRGGFVQKDMTRAEAEQMADAMFQRFDTNDDGTVTREEAQQAAAQFGGGDRAQHMIDRVFGGAQSITLQQFEAQALTRFDAQDTNHDGTVTSEERHQARAHMRAQRGQNPGQ